MTGSDSIVATLLAMLLVVSTLGAGVAPAAAASPDGMVALSDSQVSSNVPAHALDRFETNAGAWDVQASDHASDLEVEITTESVRRGLVNSPQLDEEADSLVLVIGDDVNHEGREVAVDAAVLEESVGHRPELAYGLHENGSTWKSSISYENGYAVWEIPYFSTNDVTFDGTFAIVATPTQDGDQFTYNTSDGGENLNISVTGSTATEWDNETASSLENGETMPVSVAGNIDPTGPSSNDEPTITFTGKPANPTHSPIDDEGGGSVDDEYVAFGDDNNDNGYKSKIEVEPKRSGNVTELTIHVSSQSYMDYDPVIDIYIEQKALDSSFDGGTQVKSGFTVPASAGSYTVTLDSEFPVDSGKKYEIEFHTTNPDSDGAYDWVYLGTGSGASDSDNFYSQKITYKSKDLGNVDLSINADSTQDPSVDVDGDGTADASYSGSLADGESVTRELSKLSTSTSSLDVSTTSGAVDLDVDLQERTQTVDPTVGVNGNNTSHTGALADGETASLSTNDTWIVDGTNNVSVAVGDGTLSSDAPMPEVNLDYTHDVVETQSIEYKAETFSEKYSANKTWADDTENAQFSVGWASDRVIAVREIEVRYYDDNDTHQSTTTSPVYTLENNTLTVDLGDVPAGWTTEVRTTGSKVVVENGEIIVLEPTKAGNTLDSKLEITNRSDGFGIDVGGTAEGHFTHYTSDESWSTPSAYAEAHADGTQYVRVPDAPESATFRIKNAPVEVAPESGAVEVLVYDADKPEFRIRQGDTVGADGVTVGYYDTISGDRYVLWDVGADREVDADRAESPVFFSTNDDSTTYSILQRDAISGSTGGAPVPEQGSEPTGPMLLVIPLAGFTVAGLWYGGRRVGLTGGRGVLALTGASLLVGVATIEFVTARPVVSDVAFAFSRVASDAVASGAGALVIGLAVLVGLWQLEERTSRNVPWWVIGFGGVAVAVFTFETIRPGSILGTFSDVLGEVGAAVVMLGLVAGAVILWRRQQAKAQPDTQITLDVGDGGDD